MIWIQVRDVHADTPGWSPHHPGARNGALRLDRDVDSRTPMASRSCWSRFPPITFSVVTRDRRHRQGADPYAAIEGI
jgi:hypothetical protein